MPGGTDAVNYYFHDKDRRGSAAEWNSTGYTVINASDDNRGADLIGARIRAASIAKYVNARARLFEKCIYIDETSKI